MECQQLINQSKVDGKLTFNKSVQKANGMFTFYNKIKLLNVDEMVTFHQSFKTQMKCLHIKIDDNNNNNNNEIFYSPLFENFQVECLH